MTEEQILKDLLDRVPGDAHPAVANLLRRTVMNLNTPISTVAMEVFSTRLLLDRLAVCAEQDRVAVISDLREVCQNLEDVVAQLTACARAMGELIPAAASRA